MFNTIAAVLVFLWLVGLISGFVMGGLIHVLLGIALVMVVLQVVNARRVAREFRRPASRREQDMLNK